MFSNIRLKTQKRILIVSFIAVPLFLLLLFSYYPAIKLFQYSFTNWDGLDPQLHYVGLKNYIEAFHDKKAMLAILNNGAYLIAMVIQMALALYLAIILNGRIKGRNFFRSVLFLPYILNGVAVAFMFNYLYDAQKGPINQFLGIFGIHIKTFFPANYMGNFSLAFISLWMYTGFSMVLILGALQSIPNDIYEAASIDGASFLQTAIYITLPNIKTIIEYLLFTGISGSLQAYFQVYVMTQGGPAGKTDTFVTKSLYLAFQDQKYGKASAMSVMLLVLVVILIVIQKLALGKEED